MYYLIVLLAVTLGYFLSYALTYLYLKRNSNKIKEEFSWFESDEYDRLIKECGE